jgi:hypothetical protein
MDMNLRSTSRLHGVKSQETHFNSLPRRENFKSLMGTVFVKYIHGTVQQITKKQFHKESPSPQANNPLRYSFYGNLSSLGNRLHESANRSYPKPDKSTPCAVQ